MSTRGALAVAAIALAVFVQPVAAQPDYRGGYYNDRDRGDTVGTLQDAYRDGYRAGYQDARQRKRYDDRPPYQYSRGSDYQRPYGGGAGDDRDAAWRRHYGQTY